MYSWSTAAARSALPWQGSMPPASRSPSPDGWRITCPQVVRKRSTDLVFLPEGRALVHGYVVGLVALDLVLRIILAGVMGMAFVVGVPGMHLHDMAAHVARLRVPTHMVTHFELCRHRRSPPGDRP